AEPAPPVQRPRTRVVSHSVERAHLVFPRARLRARHQAWGLRLPERVSIIPHGWDLGPGPTGPAVVPDDAPVVFLFLGKLLPAKGVGLLLDAWGEGIAGAELWIAGAGPLDAAVAEAADAGRVRRLGWLDDTG